jgi:dethiobiotin synthetase
MTDAGGEGAARSVKHLRAVESGPARARGIFVTATDTGAGKTVVAAAIAAALRARGERIAAFKPVLTGADEPIDPDWPPDDVLLAAAAGTTPEAVTPARYGPPVSPHLAAALAERPLDPAALRAAFAARAAEADAVVVEGVGGLLVPLTDGYLVRDLAADLVLPLVVAARPGLGTINHALLTLEAASGAGLWVAGVVITPWPEQPSAMEQDNRATIARLGNVEVATLPPIPRADPVLLAAAGAQLPLDRWLDG